MEGSDAWVSCEAVSLEACEQRTHLCPSQAVGRLWFVPGPSFRRAAHAPHQSEQAERMAKLDEATKRRFKT